MRLVIVADSVEERHYGEDPAISDRDEARNLVEFVCMYGERLRRSRHNMLRSGGKRSERCRLRVLDQDGLDLGEPREPPDRAGAEVAV